MRDGVPRGHRDEGTIGSGTGGTGGPGTGGHGEPSAVRGVGASGHDYPGLTTP